MGGNGLVKTNDVFLYLGGGGCEEGRDFMRN